MTIAICKECGKEDEIHAHGKCYHCYKKSYKEPLITCKVCGKVKRHGSHGMCKNCANKLYFYDVIKRFNVKKMHNISLDLWEEITKKCFLCDFDKIIDLHHLDRNHRNTSRENLVGLCPNHHKMIHDMRFRNEIENQIKEKMSENTKIRPSSIK
jgi:hypothetical protein